MLKVDARFKTWLRSRLKDPVYTEEFVRRTAELEDITITEIWPHAALPYPVETDPELMIGMVKGHDNKQNTDFIVGIFGNGDEMGIVSNVYMSCFWEPYHPVTDEDFKNLPVLYEIGFTDQDSDKAMFHVRYVRSSGDEILDEDACKKYRLNLINTRNDTDLIKMITRGKKDA